MKNIEFGRKNWHFGRFKISELTHITIDSFMSFKRLLKRKISGAKVASVSAKTPFNLSFVYSRYVKGASFCYERVVLSVKKASPYKILLSTYPPRDNRKQEKYTVEVASLL